jgi:hypothetical protein
VSPEPVTVTSCGAGAGGGGGATLLVARATTVCDVSVGVLQAARRREAAARAGSAADARLMSGPYGVVVRIRSS